MSWYCKNPEEHHREGREDFERRGYYDHQQYNQPFDECSRHYTEGYDQARREEEYREESRQEERRMEERQQQEEFYRQQRLREQEEYAYQAHLEEQQRIDDENKYWETRINEHLESLKP